MGQESGYPTGKRLVATVRRYTSEEVYHISVQQYGLKVVTDGKSVELISPQLFRNRAVGLCGNLDLESVACVQSPGQCIMRPNLAAMSYMTTRNMINANAQCSVQAKSPREFPEYNKELQACVKEEFVPTQITPIFWKRNFRTWIRRWHGSWRTHEFRSVWWSWIWKPSRSLRLHAKGYYVYGFRLF